MRLCSVEACGGKYYCKSYCIKHYQRMKKTGSIAEPVRKSLEVRFWAFVDKTRTCWLWTGGLKGRGKNGYGSFRIKGKGCVGAHRVSYELLVGDIPAGLELDHLCRNPRCVNPEHLEVVSHRENVLRGNSPAARHAKRTHCPQGHLYGGENLRRDSQGRRCRICTSPTARKAWQEIKAKADIQWQ